MVEVDHPLISVVIPAFNDELFIAEAINSVLAQDYPVIEVIVVDDGSTDRTNAVVKGFGHKVRLLKQPNRGAAAARNRGVEAANGAYIAFLDADDFWKRDKLRIQLHALRQSGYKMAYSGFTVWELNSDGRYPPAAEHLETSSRLRRGASMVKSGWLYADLLLDCIVWTSTVLIEAAELRRVGPFDVTLRKGQDYDLWLRLSRRLPMLGIDAPLALYRNNNASITHRLTDECFEYTVVSSALENWGDVSPQSGARPAPGSVQRRLRRILFNHGLAHYSRGKMDIAAQSFLQSLSRHGFAIKPFVYLLLASLRRLHLSSRRRAKR